MDTRSLRFLLVALIVCVSTPVPVVHAAVFTVTNLNDNGAGSLRQAIVSADGTAGADTITFSVSGTITLASILPAITDAAGLTIDGTGQTLTISGDNAVRVMQVGPGASLTLNGVTIANGNGANNFGGGLNNDGGTLTVTNSTFSDNSANDGRGGAIYNTGTLTITNSTFSSNSSNSGSGGGIYTSGPTVSITNSTFSGNSASGFGAAGIHNNGIGVVTLRNTIVANSLGGNCGGAITNGGNNIDDGTTCGWGALSGSMSNTGPALAALADNGASTQTFALLTDSPAIDGVTFGAPNGAPPTDQRGVARPQGLRHDIGAFELAPAVVFTVNTSADTNDGACDTLGQGGGNQDCTLREAINAANAQAGANTVAFNVSGTITLVGSQLPNITDAAGLTVDGAGQTLTVSGNSAVRVMQVSAGASLTLNNLTIANGSGGTSGGGMFNFGSVTITNSTFSGNSATGFGGGINNAAGSMLAITNSTFSGNSAGNGFGGGVYASRPLTVTNSTFSGNSATSGGSGIYNNSFAATNVTLRNTIVADNVGAGNCTGGITNAGNNLDSGTTCGWGANSGSMSNTNPLLGALAPNGGPTPTFALLTGSPAIDGATFSAPNSAPATDQRGFARPNGVRGDIGAFERQFIDDPITAGATIVLVVHITELRTRIDAVRTANGLLAYEWTDPSLVASASIIRAQHISDLRTALGEAYVAAGQVAPTYVTDPPPGLAPGVAVKAAHITELRAALLAIE